MTPPLTIIGLVLVDEPVDLGAFRLLDYPSSNASFCKLIRGGEHGVTVDNEQRAERDLAAGFTDALNLEGLALFHAVLLAAGLHYCVQRQPILSVDHWFAAEKLLLKRHTRAWPPCDLFEEVVADAVAEDLPTPVAEDLASYIVENLGLDADGFFVRFGSRRIRAGEMLGSQMISQISVPGPREVAAETIQRVVSQLQLEATSTESSPRSAQISGSYYLEGDLVSRAPILALYRVFSQQVEVIDREGRIWQIGLPD